MLLGSKPAFSWRDSYFGSLPGLWSPERFFSPQGGAGFILLSEGRGLLSLLTLEDPRLWASLATSSGPFQNLQFLTGLRACQPPYSGGGRKVASHWSLRDGGWKS